MPHPLFVPFQNLRPNTEMHGSWWTTPQEPESRLIWYSNAHAEEERMRGSKEGLKRREGIFGDPLQ